ncbi:MAG: DUF480 domain-containing protein [Opitutus sp.]|nr:DUF480 domain-containing protein [Opitutus sp.]
MADALPPLNAAEIRVLGSLVEKAITTPDYYPLTLNALTNACNQLTNRDPVVAFDETTVVRALDGLRDKRLGSMFTGADSRVAKYKHSLTDALLLTPAEVALLCVLMLRGPQTIGELRTRSERLFAFDTLPEVEETLSALAARQPQPLVTKLPRQPGTKESRYAQLLSGPVELSAPAAAPAESGPKPEPATLTVRAENERIARLERDVAELQRELTDVKQQFAAFRKQSRITGRLFVGTATLLSPLRERTIRPFTRDWIFAKNHSVEPVRPRPNGNQSVGRALRARPS